MKKIVIGLVLAVSFAFYSSPHEKSKSSDCGCSTSGSCACTMSCCCAACGN